MGRVTEQKTGTHSRSRIDIAGQRFGKLVVLERAPNVGKYTAWRCRCDCGQEAVVATRKLRTGHTVSCGCVHSLGIGKVLHYVDGTCVEMIASDTVRRNNTSGVPGVTWVPSKRLWRATICFKGRRRYLGGYRSFEDAVKARKRAEQELFEPFLQEFVAANG